ncbi:hypothetical protein H8356DRAFT_1072863 [Neocallimastix lanati (nom. inval.)]|nr:hypothetical protein H8356DRAFT_1072863 [Neocallimastix sp. JGI-2020a]
MKIFSYLPFNFKTIKNILLKIYLYNSLIIYIKMGKKITLSFGGGMEILFNNTKEREVELPDNVVNIKDLIAYMKDELLQERPELFVLNDTVRPGIIVLINNADWEIEGGLEYEIEKGDEITFISTLHGG